MTNTQQQGAEPPMYLQRPSSARSQDVAHILAHTFRELFTRDSVGQDTVQYLNKSRGGNDIYHEKYVDALQKVQEERERRISEVSMLERHIMQAQARAMSADERALNRASSAASNFPDLGLPPPRSSFRSCIDSELLRDYDLITPEDFGTEEPPIVPAPQRTPSAVPYLRQASSVHSTSSVPSIPAYARETVTSSKKKQLEMEGNLYNGSPLPSHRSLHSSLSSASEESHPIGNGQENVSAGPAGRSHTWANQLNPEDREVNRTNLANLQSKVDYLRNPRHVVPKGAGEETLIKHKKKAPKQIGIKSKPDKEERKEAPVIFVPSPPVIRFTEYTVGQVYEITLELKNVTKAMRPVRVVPPRTGYFAVGLGQFPGEHGLVAPGMSCHYTIRFSPDSMADYDDYLTVQTQSGSPMLIPLQGRRPPPVLTLPENMSVGQCLVGGCKITRLMVVNEGGPGRFCVMKRDQWPASNFKRTVSSTSVSLPPFEVRPAVFEMARNSKTIIEVIFSPPAKTTFTENLTIVCDNCHVKHFTISGEGQVAGVQLVSVEGGLAAAAPGELCDVTAQHLVRFDSLNPYTYFQRTVHVENLANVEVPFTWVAVKPLMEPPDPEAEAGPRVGPQERVQDVDSAFSIEPQAGSLPASSISEFVVTFAPPKIQKFHSALHLILRDIPSQPAPPAVERPASATSDGVAEIVLPANGIPSQTQDLTALELEIKGECEPFSVMLQPYAIYVPGENLVETSVKRQFRMVNTSVSSVLFQWEKVHCEGYIMEVEPPLGELGPQEELEFDLAISGSKPGRIKHTMECHVQHLENPLTLFVQADIKGPEVQIENPDLNFGLVRLGERVKNTVRIRNMCQVSAYWNIEESPRHACGNSEDSPEFVFSPSGGELRPLETQDITVVFMPRERKSLRTVFDLHIFNGSYSALMVRGEVQTPLACLLNASLTMTDVYLEVPTLHEVNLLNQTLLDTTYEWGQLEGDDADFCSVVVEPRAARLGPRENVQLAVHFTAHRRGPLTDLRIPCFVEGMEKPLYLALDCEVHGLEVTYRTEKMKNSGSSVEQEELELDFGKANIGDATRRLLYIKNNSAITAPFCLFMDNFSSKPPTPPGGRPSPQMLTKTSQRRALLGRTPNLADPKSKTADKAQVELSRAVLRPGKGAAFVIEPSNGLLGPFGEQLVEITGFSDMWGHYMDTLNCRVENLDLVKIPVKMAVSGCPLQFQMVAAQPSQKPILRFGTHISGVEPVVRQMRINNLSPFDIRVDWQIFNDDVESEQVVDLVTTFGTPFPLLDPNGMEIVPPEEELFSESDFSDEEEMVATVSRPRLPTDYIANSPGTTPAMSRQVTQISERGEEDREDAIEECSPTSGSPAKSEDPRPKVVTLTLREHLGININKPYDIRPSQTIIPAKGNNCINVSFTPLSEGESVVGQDSNGFALGYMSLIDEVAGVEKQVDRCHGYDVAPVRLDMTAHIKPALLTIECAEEDGMLYRAAASDLLRDDQLMPEHLRLCGARLSNMTETPLIYQLITEEPFQLVLTDPRTRKPMAQLLETNSQTLHPRHNMMVQVGFRLSTELLHLAELLSAGEEVDRDGVELETRKQERRLHFKHNLIVRFNNNTVQRLPIYAILTLPALVLSKSELDFGTCLVGQRREMQLELSNPTGSGSKWAAIVETSSEQCSDGTFIVTPSSGTLEPYITYVSKNKVLIKVFFEAQHAEKYSAVFVFHGILGEIPVRLEVRGEGSYDGKHEALVNV